MDERRRDKPLDTATPVKGHKPLGAGHAIKAEDCKHRECVLEREVARLADREAAFVEALRYIVQRSSSVHRKPGDRNAVHNTAKGVLTDTRTIGDRNEWEEGEGWAEFVLVRRALIQHWHKEGWTAGAIAHKLSMNAAQVAEILKTPVAP